MKKGVIIGIIVVWIISLSSVLANSTYPLCERYEINKVKYYDKWLDSKYNDPNKDSYYNSYNSYKTSYYNCIDSENKKSSILFKEGFSAFEYKNYKVAAEKFKQTLKIIPNDENVKFNLRLSYYNLGLGYFDKKQYKEAITNYKKADQYGYPNKYNIYFNIGVSYYLLNDIKKALQYYDKALDNTFDEDQIKEVNNRIAIVKLIDTENKKLVTEKKNAPSNDTYSYKQWYINTLNIRKAQRSFTKNKQVVIAIIDDGININHPELTDNIWINKGEIPGNGIDDDNNGYIDDFNGWNFASDNLINITPVGSHGTSVAGLIGAKSNNKDGIMGITKNVKIMNLRAFEANGGAYTESIINAIDYAIDNGADIINMSLTSNHLLGYSNKYDEILKKANREGVIVVIAAGNGDYLSLQTEGVNTTVNKLSPVCNGVNYYNVISIGSINEEGFRSRWSNYGNCVNIYAPGENIFTLSVLSNNSTYGDKYDIVDGTSFSAPIVSGIIGLGYNKYGKMDPKIIYEALSKSVITKGGYRIDTYIYLEELGKKVKLNKKVDLIMKKIDKAFSKYNNLKKIRMYNKYINVLSTYSKKAKAGNKKDLIDLLVIKMQQRIK